MNKELIMNPNQLVAFLEKPCAEFTKEDIKRYIQQNGIRMVNFMYPAGTVHTFSTSQDSI